MKKNILIIALMSLTSLGLYAQNKLTVKVTDIVKPKGELYVGLYSSNDVFLGKSSEGKIVKVEGDAAEIVFTGLKDDKYAIAMYHDENSNGKLDLGEYGIPKERYGFSNNANPAILMRQPNFEECMFEVDADKEISVKLQSIVLR